MGAIMEIHSSNRKSNLPPSMAQKKAKEICRKNACETFSILLYKLFLAHLLSFMLR